MIELVVAITLLGVMGALLMPRLAPQQEGYVGIGALLEKPRRGLAYAWIARSFPGSPAEKAGLRFGDLIVQVDGQDMLNESLESLGDRCMGGPAGSPVQLTIIRDGEQIPLTHGGPGAPGARGQAIVRYGEQISLTLHREWIKLPARDRERYAVSSDRSRVAVGW